MMGQNDLRTMKTGSIGLKIKEKIDTDFGERLELNVIDTS